MAAINLNQVRLDLISIIKPVLTSGVPFIKAEQNAPRPTHRPYLTFKIMPPIQIGRVDRSKFNGTTGNETNRTLNQIDVVINGYGEGSHNELQKLRFQFNKSSISQALLEKELSFVDITELTDTTMLLDQKWEERGSFVLSLYHIHSEDDLVGTIESVEVTGELSDLEDNIVSNDTTTISI